MSREAHAGICESRGVRLPPATRPSGFAVQAESPNHRKRRRSRAGVVSVAEKSRRDRDR